jgi:hypothetical protein
MFDWLQYIINYEDLIRAKINTNEKSINHYNNWGKKEGRTDKVIVDFDWKQYIENYEDLSKAGINTKEQAILHYINNGFFEDRVFDNSIISIKDTNVQNVFYISNNTGGGSWKYIVDITKFLKEKRRNIFRIKDKNQLNYFSNFFKKGDILIFQFLFYTDFKFEDIINIVRNYNLQLVIPIHDNYFLNNFRNDYISLDIHEKTSEMSEIKKELFREASHIIFPSKNICDIYSQFIKLPTFRVVPHIDLKLNIDYHIVPEIVNTLNIGIITENSKYKGANEIDLLIARHKTINIGEINYNINFYMYNSYINNKKYKNVICRVKYSENNIFKMLEEDNIHCLLFLNKWPETYSYALTKGINSGLSIMYTDIGAISERLKALNKEYYFPTDNNNLSEVFEEMLKYLVINNNKRVGIKPEIKIEVNNFYRDLFIKNETLIIEKVNKIFLTNKEKYQKIFNKIEPFAIYFPQFHEIEENNINFYKGFTDFENLKVQEKIEPICNLITPMNNLLGYYDLKYDKDIIDKQVFLAKSFGLKGFGIYYYWFSENTVGKNKMVFKDVIDRFFQKDYDGFEVFFMYCNESWTKNPAFSVDENNNYKIQNTFNQETILENLNNLLPYFKHNNYKKIDNKPVFTLHHPFEMEDNEIDLFFKISNELLINNGFNGIELVLNNMHKNYEKYEKYYHHSNYKTNKQNKFLSFNGKNRYIDYKKYVEDFLESERNNDNEYIINTVFTNFNNSVRFFKHTKKDIYITKTVNNSIELFKKFLDYQFTKYFSKTKTLHKLFFINAWNEWGEQMVLEPSNEQEFLYLETFTEKLIEYFN